jgi:serine/threonine-protein kinase
MEPLYHRHHDKDDARPGLTFTGVIRAEERDMSAPDTAPALAKYRLIAEIGHGGMADVFLAVIQGPAGFNKLVVIKKARKELAADPEFLAMFLDEARLAARLNHPNVVQTTEVGQEGDRYFIAMEYLDGQPLNRVRARAGAAFTVGLQARVLSDVLAGLHHAHELCDFDGTPLGVVHRDATPQNVFVTYDGLIKVVDFGIAKAVDSSNETRQGVVKGKVTYMAPEQAGGKKVDRRVDVFAVGVMLWEAIAGRRMWKGTPDIVVIQQLTMGRVPAIREAAPDVPAALAAICERALAPSPDDRYATAQEMHEALEGYLRSVESSSARDVGKFVAERFADDRAKVKGLIESQLRDVRWSGQFPKVTGIDLPKIDPGQVLLTPTGQKVLESGSGVQSATLLRTAEPASVSGLTNAGATLGQPPPQKPGRPVVLIGIGAVAAVAVIVLGVRFLAPGAPPPQPVAASTGEATAAAREVAAPATVAPAPGQDAVKLTVRVTPANAKIYLDDVLLSAGGFEGKVVKSDKVRKVRAEAAHFAMKEETVTLGGDVMLSFSLEKEAPGATPVGPGPRSRPAAAAALEPPAAAPPAAAPAPVPAPAATPAPAPTAGQKPKRAIDSDSPYAK